MADGFYQWVSGTSMFRNSTPLNTEDEKEKKVMSGFFDAFGSGDWKQKAIQEGHHLHQKPANEPRDVLMRSDVGEVSFITIKCPFYGKIGASSHYLQQSCLLQLQHSLLRDA